MSEEKTYPVSKRFLQQAYVNDDQYQTLYKESIEQPEAFWGKQAERIQWIKPFSKVKDVSFAKDDLHIRWFEDGTLNASANCVDRHVEKHPDRVAIFWEPDSEDVPNRVITYRELSESVNRLANGLLALGVTAGDVVTIYMPMVPEVVFSMLACARIGAVHSVVFAGFSPEALAGRIEDGGSHLVITADEGLRAGKTVPLKDNVDAAIQHCHTTEVRHVVLLQHTGGSVTFVAGRDQWYHELTAQHSTACAPREMDAEAPLFILYTSGSTGKPKGVMHTTGGYMVYASLTHEVVFDYREDDIYWCGADVGWITGHSYVVYGPLSNGASIVLYEGVPNYPDSGRCARVIDKYQVNTFYTAPTAIRALMADGDSVVAQSDLSSLKLTATAGEPINPEAWRWFHEAFCKGESPIIDTWWQTETGGVMITPLPGATQLKPGSATRPFFGIKPALMDADGKELHGEAQGNLVITDSWPGQMRTVYGDHQRFIDTYFSTYEGVYFTSDGARRDSDGYYWITGRVDDVLNVSGHRMGTAEIESALVAHEAVAEAAVVGYPHEIKGQGIYIYITLNRGEVTDDVMKQTLTKWLRKEIGPIATPDIIQWAPGLPKTRSGKIMRRILRKIATGESDQLGDISTLAEPDVVEQLINGYKQLMDTRAA
ncbi:MAG: acetate--CoA ligase [Pseudomonadales bacterium]|nr:acetate--CoA ligase [Pseudomonadales bacterium]